MLLRSHREAHEETGRETHESPPEGEGATQPYVVQQEVYTASAEPTVYDLPASPTPEGIGQAQPHTQPLTSSAPPPAAERHQPQPTAQRQPPMDATLAQPMAGAVAAPRQDGRYGRDGRESQPNRSGSFAGQHIPLGDLPSLTLGRGPENTVVLEHPTVSIQHAQLTRTAQGEWVITDLASHNGTFVNGLRVSRARLLAGAEIRIGPYRFVFTSTELTRYDDARSIRIDAVNLTERVGVGLLGQRQKVILDDVSLSILPGSFVVVIGSSGAGKSTLLNALSGQRPAQQGTVLYNGQDFYHHLGEFNTAIGIVPQDDIIHKNLTVERALYYAARLRLPRDYSRRQIRAAIDEALEDTELTAQRHQLVSQLSGGQRKRVSIGVELLARPAVFFLDEPTSGLDPGLDRKLMHLLRRLADRGHTIILSTHTTADIDICDYVCFLTRGGKLGYFGTPAEMQSYFQQADYADIYNEVNEEPERWVALFRQSPDYLKYIASPHMQAQSQAQSALAADAQLARHGHRAPPSRAVGRRTGMVRQCFLLTTRYLELVLRDRTNVAILLAQAPIIALFIVLLAQKDVFKHISTPLDLLQPTDYDAQRTLFIMVTSAIWFGIINAAREIVKEAPIYQRERTINLGVVPYVLSKVMVLSGLCAIQSVFLLVVVGWKTGFPTHGVYFPWLHGTAFYGMNGAFLEMLLTLFLTSLVGLMIGLLVSALSPNTDRAISIVPIVLIPQIIFSEVIFTLSGVAESISYIIPARWGQQALGSVVQLHNQFTANGDLKFYHSDPPHLIGYWAALCALGVLFFLLTLYFQRRKDVLR